MAGTEYTIDECAKCVADAFGECRLNKHKYTNCAAGNAKDSHANVTLDQDEYIQQLRPIQHHEFTGANAEAQASDMVIDMFALRGDVAYAPYHTSAVDGAWCVVTARRRTDRHSRATSGRDPWEVADLPEEDRRSSNGTNGR
eukprot:3268783-Pyramimonas_sp.AAC.1